MLGQARLLMLDKRWDQARAALEPLVRGGDQALVVEAAYGIGETYRGENDQLAAAEYYMTAAYLSPESEPGRRSLLGAAQAFVSLKQPDAATTTRLRQRVATVARSRTPRGRGSPRSAAASERDRSIRPHELRR